MNALQNLDMSALIYLGVFVGVLIAFEGVREMLWGNRHERTRSRRLRSIRHDASPEEVLLSLRTRRSSWQRVPLIGALPARLRQAGIEINPLVALLAVLALAGIGFVVAQQFLPLAMAAAATVALAFLVPLAVVEQMRKRRMDKLVSQLPDALDLMARGLRVGHPLNTTVANVARDMPQPIAAEFSHVAAQISYGDYLPNAFHDMAARIDQEDFHFLSAAIAIQSGSGGNLGRVLRTMSKVIRDRAGLRRKVVAISSEGRLSALILSMLPLVIFGATSFTSPSYYGAVRDDPLFMPVAVIVAMLMVANFVILRKLVNFKV